VASTQSFLGGVSGIYHECGACGKVYVEPGWGTALKPAAEFIILARKPLGSTVAACVQKHGTGALNIDGCRMGEREERELNRAASIGYGGSEPQGVVVDGGLGRWPANIVHDGSDEVLAVFPQQKSPAPYVRSTNDPTEYVGLPGTIRKAGDIVPGFGDEGSAARFFASFPNGRDTEHGQDRYKTSGSTDFGMLPGQRRESVDAARFRYCAKATTAERNDGMWDAPEEYETSGPRGHSANGDGSPRPRPRPRCNFHPTVKPIALMRWLVRLITPPGGIVLDPFMGSGTTLIAARTEGFRSIGIDLEANHCEIARGRMSQAVMPLTF
jgi:site-specific DNA-methyltransferase (adenine-specific)